MPMILKHTKSYFRFVEQSAKRLSLKSYFLFLPQQLEIINCHFHAQPLSSKTFHERRRSTVREGKFNQVIKHFLLKHQLNLMVFLLPLLLYAGESLSCAVNNKRDEQKSNCTRFFSVSIRVLREIKSKQKRWERAE